jgi:predicted nuclease of restriction endonuclease-like (RecB) superfamily
MTKNKIKVIKTDYSSLVKNISNILDAARKNTTRAVNVILTATYWEIGKRIIEFEQIGEERAEYGQQLLKKLSDDLTKKFGRGFSERNLELMRLFYLSHPISQTVSAKSSKRFSNRNTPSGKSSNNLANTNSTLTFISNLSDLFPLPWSHYVRLLSVKNEEARKFYETEALRNGWSVRQLDRQISSQFYERTLLSKNKAAMLKKGSKAKNEDLISPEEEIKDPFILEFLNLKDEYSENDLEEALILHLEKFLLELGGDFAFVGRQKRLRIGNEWYRVDLLFFHRKLKCLVVIDLKVGKFTHADAGQMHLYLNYAKENWTNEGENPPVGLILCAEKDNAVAKYALEGLPNKILASEYKLMLPDEKLLAKEIQQTRKILENRKVVRN